MRRRQREEGSLELLLDTICNVFGGVVFIAILVALLTTARTSEVHETPEDTAADVELARQYEQLGDERERYAASLAQLEATQQVLEEGQDAERRQELVESIARLSGELSEAERALRANAAWMDQAARAREEHAEAVQEEVEQAEASLAELETAKAELRDRHTHEARLHMERRTDKRQLLLMLLGDRVYVVAATGTQQPAEDAGIRRQVRLRDRGGSIEVEPMRGRGMAAEGLAANADLQQLMQAFDAADYFLDMFVYGDAVATYEAMRGAAVEAGYEYNVTPVEERPLTLYTTRQGRPVQ